MYYQQDHLVERCSLNGNGTYGYACYGGGSVRNNVIVNNANGAFLDDRLEQGIDFWNNTVALNSSVAVRSYHGNIELRNNIVSNSNWGCYVDSTANVTNSNNLVSGNAAANYWHPTKTATQLKGAGDVNKSPRFMNATGGDYRLAKGSPAINAGYTASGIVDIDILGNARPQFKMYEIGAYEYTDPSGSIRVMTWNEQR